MKTVTLCIILSFLLFFAFLFLLFENTVALSGTTPTGSRVGSVEVLEDRVIIYLKNPSLVGYSSNSMSPTLSENAKGIEIKPSSPEEIRIGDIISYKKNGEIVSHRVIEIGKDDKGWYCKTKGDKSFFDDGKVRFDQIVGILVVIIY